MRFWRFLAEYFRKHWIRLLVCFLMCIAFAVIYNVSNDGWKYIVCYSNGTFIGGMITVLFGLLTVVNYFGGLDIFSYMFRARYIDNHRESLYEYSERKKVERKPAAFAFVDYLIVGGIFVIASQILLIFA